MRNLDKIIVFQVPSNFVSIVGVKICHKFRETENKLLSKEMLVGLEPSYVQGPNTNPIWTIAFLYFASVCLGTHKHVHKHT